MPLEQPKSRIWLFLLLTALSMSVAWGVRGKFGFEYGAAPAGALGGMVIALLSGRQDWLRRIPFFAVLGAIGIAFGGSISYGKEIGYSHSSDPATVLYGFACIFVIGFLWAAPAGTGISLPVFLHREELTKLFVPICTVFIAWYLQDICMGFFQISDSRWSQFFAGYEMRAILAALIAASFFLFLRKYRGIGASLILYMAIGWLAGNLLFIQVFHLAMNPPRAETWASALGMVLGILACCWRNRLNGTAFATLGAGFLGGIGYALAVAVKLWLMSSGLATNWWSIMEQLQGFFIGLALSAIFAMLIRRAPVVTDTPPVRRWTEVFSVTFVLWLLPYLNFRQSPRNWLQEIKDLQPKIYGIPIVGDLLPSRGFMGWMDFFAVALAIILILLLTLHLRRPLPFIPTNWTGKGQIFYMVFIGSIVLMGFMLLLPRFSPELVVTYGLIVLNAIICIPLLIYGCFARSPQTSEISFDRPYAPWIRKIVLFGILGGIGISLLGFGVKLACWGNRPAGYFHQDHIRFGPNNTNTISAFR